MWASFMCSPQSSAQTFGRKVSGRDEGGSPQIQTWHQHPTVARPLRSKTIAGKGSDFDSKTDG